MSVSRFARFVRNRSRLDILVASWILTGCTTGTIPAAPSDVGATPGPGTLSVSWSDDSEDETGFVVLRVTDGDFTDVATVPSDTVTYLDGDVTGEAPYGYRVAAVGTGGRSALSDPSLPVRPLAAGVPIVDPDDPVGVALNTLGVDTTATPRLGDDGAPLPDDYAPLGATATLGVDGRAAAPYELFIGGAATSRDGFTSNQVIWQADDDADPKS